MRFFRWTHDSGADEAAPSRLLWYLDIQMIELEPWDLMAGRRIENWNLDTTAYYEGEVAHIDFPFTDNDLPVYSPRLKLLMERLAVTEIQYLPLRVAHQDRRSEVSGYYLANYLRLIDCLDRKRSEYQVWTRDNLPFWEKRPRMLGTFRDVTKAVLDTTKIGDVRVFRVWGWDVMVVVGGDVKQAIEEAGMTGCRFTEIETI
jgi:hypothetical protein